MKALRNAYRMLVKNQSEMGHLEDLGINGDTVKMDFTETG
jgi:hypothetical protein